MKPVKFVFPIMLLAYPFASPSQLAAKAVVEKKDERLVYDWTTLKVRTYGKVVPDKAGEELAVLEKRAMAEATVALKDPLTKALKAYYESGKEELLGHEKLEAKVKNVLGSVSKTLYPYNTEYFLDGGIKIHLENSLAKVFLRPDITFKIQKPGSLEKSPFSAIILRLQTRAAPVPSFHIIDEIGRSLYSIHDIAKEAYEKALMAKWVENPTQQELSQIAGSKPISMEGALDAQGNFVVPGNAWNEALRDAHSLLENGKVVIVIPAVL